MDWIRESNLIEGVDDGLEDQRCHRVWRELQTQTHEWRLETVLWIHRRIMWVLNPRIRGHWRECNVRVCHHVAPNWDEVKFLMIAWIANSKFSHERGWDYIQHDHVSFERIHPFEDGNGRTGRMIMNWQRVKNGMEPLCIEASKRQDYYQWFNHTTAPPVEAQAGRR